MRTNVDSVFMVGQAVARHMIARGKGKIINICSVQSELGRPNIAPYTASKGAVKMLTKGMAIDWGQHGIQVTETRPCHDCEQGFTDEPGPPAHIQAQVLASLDLGTGRWVPLADPAEVLALKSRFRAPGVVYPGESTCLNGHDLRQHRPVMGANGRMCGHPSHHPEVTAETEEVDW